MGRRAIAALKEYRTLSAGAAAAKSQKTGNVVANTASVHRICQLKEELRATMSYYGYGFVKDPNQIVPYVPVNFWCFRIMVGMGCLFILFFLAMGYLSFRTPKLPQQTWLHKVALALLPLAYIASECGWVVAELGRQPWTIQDMLPTWAAISDVQSSSVVLTFFIFLVLFTTMLAVEISILCKQIKRGPEHSDENKAEGTNA